MTKSHIPTANIPSWINVPVGQLMNKKANESKAHLKCGRLVGSKYKVPRKKKKDKSMKNGNLEDNGSLKEITKK